jgi:RimJ/RimL family protein N-acetyltransferase
MSRPIQMWRFYDAPKDLQQLSGHGGDEDWIAHVPKEYEDEFFVEFAFTHNLGNLHPFGCCDISRHDLPNGDVVYIGAHA